MTTFPDRMGSDGISGGVGDALPGPGSCADASSPSVSPLRAAIPIAELPAPRLQLRWEDGDEDGLFLCHYELAIPLKKYDIRREDDDGKDVRSENVVSFGTTTRTGGAPDKFGYIDAPYRDGAHANWDAEHLGGIPIFATYAGHATRYPRPAQGMEARRAETQRGSVEDESPLPEGNAP